MYVQSSFTVPQMWFSRSAIRELGPQPPDELRALGLGEKLRRQFRLDNFANK